MTFDYFYGEQSDMFAFYRIPKVLITADYFLELSTNAKLLYGLLLDRVSLSSSNGWFDEQGRVYIIYTIASIQRDLHCGDKKATRLLAELEKWGLIERKRQGQGKPTVIYVKNFLLPSEQRFLTGENNDSGYVRITIPELSEQRCNNTEINNINNNYTNPILSEPIMDKDEEERNIYYEILCEQLEINILKERYPFEKETLDAIINMMLDVICSKRKSIRIAGDDKPVNVVKSQFLKMNSGHIEYVLDCMKENCTKVRNIKQYLLASLYNAQLTMGSYYTALVNNDMAEGKLWRNDGENTDKHTTGSCQGWDQFYTG